ncbi:hypothetical protein HS041_01785 [Planomonospora sp. ID67723]|uniref:hypothetical protein n=1 Tax=Planomonospora sp. ID67723 TaxID=2738134 RepID=UPI0018C3FB50|nr:hypothetical protein [Planomonospora sp. ID67723]MBG0826512.1 hypothetical protein [Planomonospora sp. ID67723]
MRISLASDSLDGIAPILINDADVLALSLRLTSVPPPEEILGAWFGGSVSADEADIANIAYIPEMEN